MANYSYSNSDGGEKVGPCTLTQRVYDILREEIINGSLEPGYRLVRRSESERLGVSRMAVTEALLMLERDGIVESRPMFGSRVRPLTLEDIQNDEALREALECQSAVMAAEHASGDDLKGLMKLARKLDRQMADLGGGSRKGMESHFEFHIKLARSSGYYSIADELERIWFRRLMRLNWIKATKLKPVPKKWHELIIKACIEGDAAGAQELMREHVRYGSEHNIKALEMSIEEEGTEAEG